MVEGLRLLAEAFLEKRSRIAVFDREQRARLGRWARPTRIDLGTIAETFESYPAFHRPEGLLIPLHEADSAELTGEYVLVVGEPPRLVFYDFSKPGLAGIDLEAAGATYLAHRLRFWHPGIEPPAVPSYLAEADLDGRSLGGTRARPARGGPDEARFFELTKAAVAREREAMRSARLERYRRMERRAYLEEFGGLERLEAAGRTVADDGDQRCLLVGDPEAIDAEAWLRPGVAVLVDTNDAGGFPVEAAVASVEDDEVAVAVDWSSSSAHGDAEAAFEADGGASFRLGLLLDPRPYDARLEGIEAVVADDRKRETLTGDRPVAFGTPDRDALALSGLDEFQASAVENALAADSVFCVAGPPATGKTRVLTAVVVNAIESGDRVLACGPSDAAVEELLFGEGPTDRRERRSVARFVREGRFELARLGADTDAAVDTEGGDIEPWEANVVGAPVTGTHRFRVDEFDLVVVDDAHRVGVAESLLAFSRAERLVLAGDPHEPPPIDAAPAVDARSLSAWLLERYGEGVSTYLRRQYRMNADIAGALDHLFYGDTLLHGQRNRDRTVRDLAPLEAVSVDGTEARTPGGSVYNEDEAAVVAAEVVGLLDRGVPPGRIGVVTPHTGQAGKITQAIASTGTDADVAVGTLDEASAPVRDAVVVSLVRDDPAAAPEWSPEGGGERALNVALSRAERRCVLVGDWDAIAGAAPAAEATGPVLARLGAYLEERSLVRPSGSPVRDGPAGEP